MYMRQRIVNMRQSGKSYVKISSILSDTEGVSISREAIGKFYTRFRANGTLSDPPKAAGLRKTLQDRHLVFIDEKIHADREISAQELTREINARFHINISVATIKRARKSLGWTRSATQYCQMVRHQNKPKRLDHALKCLADNEQFDDVIFTDETTVKIQTTTGRSFRKEGEPVIKTAKPKHPYQVSINVHFPYSFKKTVQINHGKIKQEVHVWGGISRRGATGLYIFTSIMDSIVYQGILTQKLVPFIQQQYPNGHRFMQDNDPKHVSRSTKAFMQNNGINHWVTPPESPDMNPIENLWGSLKYHIRRRKKPTNQQELLDGCFGNTGEAKVVDKW
ncbi:unnamed protein product [Mytilus edulis]|uniref:Tc1-like transposase DDE domain-containing protein n=1 Tax=Mytilus edulis TaxID=6550 RepID=A0A8S3S8Y4_MYTED|nr:unnamed protein product [Mytilus edulis]